MNCLNGLVRNLWPLHVSDFIFSIWLLVALENSIPPLRLDNFQVLLYQLSVLAVVTTRKGLKTRLKCCKALTPQAQL